MTSPVYQEWEPLDASSSENLSSYAAKVNAATFRKSAEIVKFGKPCLPKLREAIRKDARDLFWVTFERASLHAKALDASRKVGVSPATFTRLYDEQTGKVEYALIQAMLFWHDQKHRSVHAFPGLAVRGMIA